MPPAGPQRVLVVKPSSLGDVVHSLPFLAALKQTYPEAEVHWVIATSLMGLLEGHPLITRLWPVDKDSWKRPVRAWQTARELCSLFKGLKDQKFDLTVDLQGLLRSGVIAKASASVVRVGFSEAREGSGLFYTDKVSGGTDVHAVTRNLKIAKALGCDITNSPTFPLPVGQRPDGFTLAEGDYAVFAPGARWQTKRWPVESFGALARELDLKCVVVGTGADREMAGRIVAASGGRAMSLAGETGLKGLVEVIRGAAYMVSTDTGPMHLAAALGVPVVALFGPTDPVRTGPFGTGHCIVTAGEGCAPCFLKTCDELKCMQNITVEMVLDAVQKCKGIQDKKEGQ